ncbi:hypothetical protein EG68_11114 [Paragonimus skrjabini miyazakii]|uniref:SH3 domain-containing protein n=1 Tax=Paragonimus skrjabini miyazakii TaxID=59628 RepID=A0A8S9YGH2_9TREM|nr:hypothetical protein EG68_11114 [Paragonimus skrjabini miyazakii]
MIHARLLAAIKPVSSSGNAIATTQSNISVVSSSSTKTVPTVISASPTHTTSVDPAEVSHTKPPCSNGPVVERMQAIFSYKAAHADELTFEEGAIITVIGRDEPEWWRGRLHSTGAEGLFPMNYVRPYSPAIHEGNVNPTKSSESSQQSKKSSTPGGSNSRESV